MNEQERTNEQEQRESREIPLLSSVRGACSILGIGPTSGYAAIQRGELKVVRLGKTMRVPRDEILRVAREGFKAQE